MKKMIYYVWLFLLFGLIFFLKPYINKNLSYFKFLINKNDCHTIDAHIQQVKVEKYYQWGIETEEQNIALISYKIKKQDFSNEIEVDDGEIQRGIVKIGVNGLGDVFRADIYKFGAEKYANWIVSFGFILVGLILLIINIIFDIRNRTSNRVK